MVVVDTSVWIAYFRDATSPLDDAVDNLLDNDEALLVGPVMFELLRGSKSPNEYRYLSDRLNELPFEDTTMAIWSHASQLTYELRTRGVTMGISDALIAAIALEGSHQVFSIDADFQRVPGLRLFHDSETSA